MAKYRIVQNVRTTTGYDVLNNNTPFDVITVSNITVSGANLVATTHLLPEAFMGTEFTISIPVPNNISSVTGRFIINGTTYAFDATCLNILKASAGLSALLRVAGNTVWYYNQVVSKALNAESIDASKITGTLSAAHGGTGNTSLQATRNAMGLGNTLGVLPAANGGTGQSSLQATRNAMGLGNTLGVLPVANGGTGQTTLQAFRNAAGLGNTTGPVPVANGGTGANSAAGAKTNLGWANIYQTSGALSGPWLELTNSTYGKSCRCTTTITVTLPNADNFMVDYIPTYGTTGKFYPDYLFLWNQIVDVTSSQSDDKKTIKLTFIVPNWDYTTQLNNAYIYYKVIFFY